MSKKTATVETLEELHKSLIDALVDRVQSGEATAADFNVIRQVLKDNGIDAQPTPDSGLTLLKESLPFPGSAADHEDNPQYH